MSPRRPALHVAPRVALVLACVLSSALATGCGGAGPYGYARTYEPLDAERAYLDRAAEPSYEEVRRTRPEEQPFLAWFGVVRSVELDAASGEARVVVSLRAHQERHLCSDRGSDTCRVTVSERALGDFTARMTVAPEDREGRRRLWEGSLVRVYGRATGETDTHGGPVLAVEWYRHWPPHTYVTTGAASSMRR